MKINAQELPHLVVGVCMEVHRVLGNGFTQETYKKALAHEFRMQEFSCIMDRAVPFQYKGLDLPGAVKLDLLIEGQLALNVHVCDQLRPTHKLQLQSALHLAGIDSGFLVNFHARDLRRGIKRIIVNAPETFAPPHPFRRGTTPPDALSWQARGEGEEAERVVEG